MPYVDHSQVLYQAGLGDLLMIEWKPGTSMKLLSLPVLLCALVLAGCASQQSLVPQVRQSVAEDGARTVTVAPESVVCSRPQCPVLGASWTSAKAGLAVLTVGVPHQSAQVTGADFYLGVKPVARVRSRSGTAAQALAFPATAFDVPLTLIDQIAYSPRSWVRVHMADGRSVDETINSGDQRAKAAEAMSHFVAAVEAASGKAVNTDSPRGGLFDRLGVGENK